MKLKEDSVFIYKYDDCDVCNKNKITEKKVGDEVTVTIDGDESVKYVCSIVMFHNYKYPILRVKNIIEIVNLSSSNISLDISSINL